MPPFIYLFSFSFLIYVRYTCFYIYNAEYKRGLYINFIKKFTFENDALLRMLHSSMKIFSFYLNK